MSRQWTAILGAAIAAVALKVLGYLVPARWLAGERIARATALIPVAALAALVATQTFVDGAHGGRLTVDARALGLAAAVALLWRRANFLVVIVGAAAVAALARAAGLH